MHFCWGKDLYIVESGNLSFLAKSNLSALDINGEVKINTGQVLFDVIGTDILFSDL